MKLKKTLACVAAASVAVSALAVNAFAVAVTDNVKVNGSAGTDTFVLDLAAEGILDGVDIADVYGFSIKLSEETVAASAETGIGGGIIYNHTAGWDQLEWGNEGADKQFTMTADGVVTRMDEAPVLTAEDVSGEENTWGQIVLSFWWGPDEVAVDQVSLLGKDGSALKTFPGEAAVPGMTELPADAARIALKSTGSMNFDGAYRVNICHPWAKDDDGNLLEEYNILEDKSELSGAYTLGIHFEVAEFEDYGKPFNMDINIAENNDTTNQNYWGDPASAVGVTTTPVEVTGDGDYIVWATFAQALDADAENFFLDITTDIKEQVEAATNEAGDGLPVISILEIGVQDGTPAPGGTTPPDEPGGDEPTSTPDEPSIPEKEPTSTPDDTSKDDNNNVNTGVTLAVVPAALAAAALVGAAVATKKRK